ncbi:MAG: hypothetical protein GWM98_12135 [Nitrospinaceae bacterium]|nr:hypothetical protein [Nitrospinaceae bacterium]NIR55108.1 hypothetical protein [Nitrospinaceae bacterium]NIS85523.1 hypothetical protein [Nitrospinaceae bacterium]NIT82357.1 hypothetical protein [Nitrospinaceae bacterium]NIU44573.1 hypothetical protein [Nitrospinaceae bacterium]
MNSDGYSLQAYYEDRKGRQPFSLTIEGPYETSGSKELYCRIHSPELLGRAFNVYGTDNIQVKELALKFIQFCLQDKKVYDEEGNTLTLSPW